MSFWNWAVSRPMSLATSSACSLADMAMGRQKLLMEVPEFLAGNLLAHGGGHPRRLDRIRAEHREILEHHAQVGLGLHQVGEIAERPFAIAAIIIEKFDQRDLAVGIADHRLEVRS